MDTLGSRIYLGHLGLLYGLQLHDLNPEQAGRDRDAGLEWMCDLFEAFASAVASH